MDSKRFDEISKGLASRASRRTFVKGLSGGILGGALALAGRGRVDAKSAKVGICHHTGSTTNPWNYITVATSAVPAHQAHGDTVTDLTDTNNCGACGNVCSAPENATATCTSGGCGFICNADYQPDGNGSCSIMETGCNAALSGTDDGGIVCVDDEMKIYVNDLLVFEHLGTTNCFAPISLGSLTTGDSIQVVANNSADYCGDISIDPLYLICQNTGAVQALDPIGYPGGTQGECGAVFYDQTFIVEL